MKAIGRFLRIPRLGCLALFAGGLAAAAFGVAIIAAQIGSISVSGLLSALGIVQDSELKASRALFARMAPLYSLDMAEAVYDVVFPYDFMDETVDLTTILKSSGQGNILTAAQEDYLAAYNLSHRIGMRTGPDKYDFAVVTVSVRAGFDFSSPDAPIDRLLTADRSARSIRLRLPEARITGIRIDDPHKSDYSFPDLRIPPDGWRSIVEFVSARVPQRIAQTDLLVRVRERGRRLAVDFLRNAGFDFITLAE